MESWRRRRQAVQLLRQCRFEQEPNYNQLANAFRDIQMVSQNNDNDEDDCTCTYMAVLRERRSSAFLAAAGKAWPFCVGLHESLEGLHLHAVFLLPKPILLNNSECSCSRSTSAVRCQFAPCAA